MPTGKLYPNGLTMGMGGNPNPVGGKRGSVDGWSPAAVRRHTRWLYSIDATALHGHGWSLTLTVRDLPESAAEWSALRRAYLKRIERSGLLLRHHWVTEWTERKRPHQHLAVYLSEELTTGQAARLLVLPWLELAGQYGSGHRGQHIAPITGPVGWLEYLSKHAARGVSHYQRNGKPPGWDTTGRLWGYGGDWPTVEPAEVTLTRSEFFRYRRQVRAWRVADARAALAAATTPKAARGARRRIKAARRMLRSPDRTLSEVRGVSEWISETVGLALLDLVAGSDDGAARRQPRAAGADPSRLAPALHVA